MFGQKNWLVALLSSSTVSLCKYGEGIVQVVPLPPSIVNNLEVINKDALYTLITDWTKQRTYVNTSVIWLLAPEICFDHLLVSNEQEKIDSETLQFLDTVPFEEVLSRIYLTQEGKQVIAVNKNLVSAFIQGFALHGYITKIVLPAQFVFTGETLTSKLAQAVIKRSSELSRESLITPTGSQQDDQKVKSKSSLPLLLGIFGILLAILVFVIVLNQ